MLTHAYICDGTPGNRETITPRHYAQDIPEQSGYCRVGSTAAVHKGFYRCTGAVNSCRAAFFAVNGPSWPKHDGSGVGSGVRNVGCVLLKSCKLARVLAVSVS